MVAIRCGLNHYHAILSAPTIASVIATTLVFSIAHAQSEDCSAVDLSKRFGPVRNQADTGFCYAFAAADLLGEALGIAPPDMISSVDALTSYVALSKKERRDLDAKIKSENIPAEVIGLHGADDKSGTPVTVRDFGWSDIALAKMISNGTYCLEKDLPSQPLRDPNPDNYYDENLNFLRRQLGNLSGEFEVNSRMMTMNALKNSSKNDSNPTSLKCSPVVSHYQAISPIQNLEALHPAINDWAAVKLAASVRSKCTRPFSVKNLDVHTAYFHNYFHNQADKKLSLQKMNQLLSDGRPFIIHYPAELAKTGPRTLRHGNKPIGEMNHASVVTGRRWNAQKKRCEIQIRNTYGISCDGRAKAVDCHEGSVWLWQDSLASAQHEMVYLTK